VLDCHLHPGVLLGVHRYLRDAPSDTDPENLGAGPGSQLGGSKAPNPAGRPKTSYFSHYQSARPSK
jgi:hypothetical protein